MPKDFEPDLPIRVLVVDDSALYRKVIRTVLSESPEIDVLGTAPNGKIALQKIEQLSPDLLTLDLEMPELDGHGVLREIKTQGLSVGSIVLSAFSEQGAQATTKALEAGAFDFVLKPTASDPEQNKLQLSTTLLPKVLAFGEATRNRRKPDSSGKNSNSLEFSSSTVSDLSNLELKKKPAIIAIGISTGGPAALGQLLPRLPQDLAVPIVIVQHMPPVFTASLAEELNRSSPMKVVEGKDGMNLCPGMVAIAPGGTQMKVDRSALGTKLVVNDDPPERSCKPSVDYLFRSLAEQYGSECLPVIMTGMGNDGLLGCRLLKRRGASVVAQDEASSVVYGMPRQIIDNDLADAVCSLDQLPEKITSLVKCGALSCS